MQNVNAKQKPTSFPTPPSHSRPLQSPKPTAGSKTAQSMGNNPGGGGGADYNNGGDRGRNHENLNTGNRNRSPFKRFFPYFGNDDSSDDESDYCLDDEYDSESSDENESSDKNKRSDKDLSIYISNYEHKIHLRDKQIQAKYNSHAKAFGVTGNACRKNFELLKSKILAHMMDPSTIIIEGTYKKTIKVTHFLNPDTGLNVMIRKSDSSFLSGWELGQEQIKNVKNRGAL